MRATSPRSGMQEIRASRNLRKSVLAGIGRGLNHAEGSGAVGTHSTKLAVEIGRLCRRQRLRGLDNRQVFLRPIEPRQVRNRLAGGGGWIRTLGPPIAGRGPAARNQIFRTTTGAEAYVRRNKAADRLVRRAPDQPSRNLPPPPFLFRHRRARRGA